MKNLSIDRMSNLSGGQNITQTQYCGTLAGIMNNNGVTNAGLTAWEAHCSSRFGGFDYY
jgi:hypothetical protein